MDNELLWRAVKYLSQWYNIVRIEGLTEKQMAEWFPEMTTEERDLFKKISRRWRQAMGNGEEWGPIQLLEDGTLRVLREAKALRDKTPVPVKSPPCASCGKEIIMRGPGNPFVVICRECVDKAKEAK